MAGRSGTRWHSVAGRELLVIVPARGGSKRLPGKNLRRLGNASLLQWTAAALEQAGIEAPCLLSTDDDAIAEAGRALGWLVPFRRPAELSSDEAPTLPVVLHALDWYLAEEGGDPGTIMVLQVTSPFRGGGCLRTGLAALRDQPGADAIIGATRLERSPAGIFAEDGEGFLAPLGGENGQAPLFTPNGALYLVRTAALRRHRTLFPPNALALVMDALQSTDIDTDLDWQMAEAALAHGLVDHPAGGGTAP